METLEKAERIGREAGLKYVYMGNVARERDTQCPECGKPVVQRSMMGVRAVNLDDGKCRHCGATVDGVWK
jgi:pyruvate formate lyase activating enzyme